MDLQDKVAVVTGAGSGIGRGIAQALAARGARVAVVDIDGASAAETARLLMGTGGKALGVQVDTAVAADVDRAVSTAVSQLGPLDIMVNNAGILDGYFNVDETDDAVWARVIGINLTGVFLGCKRALKELLPRGRGRIINMASVAGLNGTGGGARVALVRLGAPAGRRDEAGRLLSGGGVEVHGGDARPARGQRLSDGAPDARARAGHHGHAVFHAHDRSLRQMARA